MSLLRTSALAMVLFVAGCGGSTSLTDDEFIDTNGTDPNPEMSRPGPAWWELDPAWPLTPETTTLQLIVMEQDCASGIPADGRIEATVDYAATEVRVAVIVHSVGGQANCPGNPPASFTIELAEPLGDRTVVGEDPIPW